MKADLKYVYLPEDNVVNTNPIYRVAFATSDEANFFLQFVKKGRMVAIEDLYQLDVQVS